MGFDVVVGEERGLVAKDLLIYIHQVRGTSAPSVLRHSDTTSWHQRLGD